MHWLYLALTVLAVALHTAFMVGEMIPWSKPALLKKLPAEFQGEQLRVAANIVKNAGIYNAIVAGGLFWALAVDDVAIARVLLVGAGVAGVFGTVTLKSKVTALQAVLGFAGFLASLRVDA
jgi:uncharacterized membrane protein